MPIGEEDFSMNLTGSDGDDVSSSAAPAMEREGEPAESLEAPEPDQTESIPGDAKTVPVPQPRLSRRDQRLATLEKRLSETVTRKDLDEIRSLLMQRQAAPAPAPEPRRQSQQRPDEDDLPAEVQLEISRLTDEGTEALQKGDLVGYHKIFARQQRLVARSEFERFQKSQPVKPDINPDFLAARVKFADVFNHPDGPNVAKMFDARIRREEGLQEGPQLWERALTEARKFLATSSKKTPKQAPAAARAAHSGVPASSTGGDEGGGRTLRLPSGMTMDDVRKVSKKAGMDVKEYLTIYAKQHPEDVQD